MYIHAPCLNKPSTYSDNTECSDVGHGPRKPKTVNQPTACRRTDKLTGKIVNCY